MNKYLIITFLLSCLCISCDVSQPTESPTEVLQHFVESSKKKDVESLKQILSKDSWKFMEETAKKQGLSVEQSIEQNTRGNRVEKMMAEFGEEKVNGNEAVVKIKNSINGNWGDAYLIKEGGKWKVDFVKPLKLLQESFQKNISDKDLDNFKK